MIGASSVHTAGQRKCTGDLESATIRKINEIRGELLIAPNPLTSQQVRHRLSAAPRFIRILGQVAQQLEES